MTSLHFLYIIIMKHIFTKLIFTTIIILNVTIVKAQDFLPFVNDNYAGVTGVHINPASIADSRYKFDMTLMGLSVNVYNNYLYGNRDYLLDYRNISDYDVKSQILGLLPQNGKDKYVYQDLRLDIMNFMVTINPRIAIGFTAGVRQYLNVDNLNEDFVNMFYNLDETPIPFNERFIGSDIRVTSSVWSEYGLTLAGVLLKTDHHVIKGGINMKLIQGHASAYANIENLDAIRISDDTASFNNTHINYGISDNIGRMITDESFDTDHLKGKFSMGFDFGIVWEWRPDYEDHLYDMDGETNLERKNENKYKLRVGLSVKDLGFVKFQRWSHSHDFVINGDVDMTMFEKIQGPEELFNVLEANEDLFTINEGDDIYRMSLPTSISLQLDYNIAKNFYINVTPYFALRQGDNKYSKVHTYNNISVAPRYESAWFGMSFPLQYSQLSGFSLGTGLRLGPLWIGSNNVLNTLFTREIAGVNVQAMLKLPIPYRKVRDDDGDKVSNKKDQCRDVYGVWENFGCPYEDTDGDGVIDKEDLCPDTYGIATLNGCPDSDGDGIKDSDDECPNTFGLAAFNGCPDSDGDGIEDRNDECPNIAGLAVFNGCPDTDGDSIPDHLDKCPNIFGLARLEGCPEADSDNDGIADVDDDCPELAGPLAFNGCPDSDGDGLRDIDDECPNIAGPIEFKGCPDSDNDSVPDQLDQCPLISGLAQFNGCPDTDGDGIQDKEDECPEEPGTAENNGCPVYEKVEFATNIGFQSGSAKLTQESYPYLDQLAQIMKDNPDCWVKLDGHTDNTGSDAINNKISQQRVDSIKDYLIEKGINPNRIVAKGHGSSKPIAPNDTAEGRAKNRRVEINLAH